MIIYVYVPFKDVITIKWNALMSPETQMNVNSPKETWLCDILSQYLLKKQTKTNNKQKNPTKWRSICIVLHLVFLIVALYSRWDDFYQMCSCFVSKDVQFETDEGACSRTLPVTGKVQMWSHTCGSLSRAFSRHHHHRVSYLGFCETLPNS